MTSYVELQYDRNCYDTSEADSTDPWDRPNTCSDWTVHGAKLADDRGYKNVPYPGDLKSGDEVYVLYAVYSTGDSFGHDENGCIEFISVHKDANLAFKNKNNLQNGKHVVEHDDGTIENIYAPWGGYFESLSYLQVDNFTL
jgi:hypothetical protein